jgi:LmbE family N-acetylglucosaminyl deacetylase
VSDLTLMAVHAHPDDEVIATGGVLAKASAEGIRTVVVTCTNGEEGDGPGGIKPDDPAHDAEAVAAQRRVELKEAISILGVGHLEMLGYRDSGMDGWEGNQRVDAFANVPVATAAARLVELMEQYRPQVVVTYDENGGYGHPDHIQAHRVTLAAVEASGIPDKLYYAAFARSAFKRFRQRLVEAGLTPEDMGWDPPAEGQDDEPPFGVADEMIDATVDVVAYADLKRRALSAHASQTDNSFFNRLPAKGFEIAFGTETFIRVQSRVEVTGPEDDLFSGLR